MMNANEIRFACPVADKCGGCQLSYMAYADQLRVKQQTVEKLLKGICPVAPIRGMEDPFHYRNKVHAVLAADKQGKPYAGVYAAGSHRVIPVKACLIEDERASRIIQTIVGMMARHNIRPYNEDTREQDLAIAVTMVKNFG